MTSPALFGGRNGAGGRFGRIWREVVTTRRRGGGEVEERGVLGRRERGKDIL